MTDTSPQIDWIAYGFLPWYPHMGADDAAVWNRYIETHPTLWDKVAYDLAVGEGAPFDTTVNPETGGNVGRIYQRRIDVVAMKGTTSAIFEIKRYASTAALGQIEGYALIAERDFPELANARLIVVAAAFAPEMQFLADKKHIELVSI